MMTRRSSRPPAAFFPLRVGKWKLVSAYKGEWELYDLEADRTEMNDLARKVRQVLDAGRAL